MNHATHLAAFDPLCDVCRYARRWAKEGLWPRPDTTATYSGLPLTYPYNPDPLRPPETDAYPLPAANPSLMGDIQRGGYPLDDEDTGLWAGVAFTLFVALAALVIGIAIGKALP